MDMREAILDKLRSMTVGIHGDYEEWMSEVCRRVLGAVLVKYRSRSPASKAAVEALMEVEVTEAVDCTVSLEGLRMATRKPCMHLFHGHCILTWLAYGVSTHVPPLQKFMAEPTPPPPPPPPVQPPSVVLRCRHCDWYCEFASHHPDSVVCPQCGREDLVDTAIEFSEIIQRMRQQRRIMVDRYLTTTFTDNREAQYMPASKESVAALEEVVVTEEELCPVCKMDMGVGDMAKRMPCKHLFHVKCISDWLEHYGHSCPVCRFGLPTDDKAAIRGGRDPGPDDGGPDAAVV
ncbi:hypothetical protein QJS04_geneDACA009610 [Acorus gramineus]|uniref:RING-type domain-containing protein n=1 Tax=Acorus gramineus TaxID=55184 RepID=A0AAV9BDJ6_ACOGR|nr:hypothetical protein QJS04_geneDACA009610 [Acorus gramineus]